MSIIYLCFLSCSSISLSSRHKNKAVTLNTDYMPNELGWKYEHSDLIPTSKVMI